MTKEEARLTLSENFGYLSEEHPRIVEALKVALNVLGEPSFPSNLDEAAHDYAWEKQDMVCDAEGERLMDYGPRYDAFKAGAKWMAKQHANDVAEATESAFNAGAEWIAGQRWIDDGSMPPEIKQESDTLQGHREWTESEPVLAWDSMYGCCVDWTTNGKWMSEQMGGYTGQVCHRIIAWRPIPEYKGNSNLIKA